MPRTGVAIIVLSVLLYLLGTTMPETPPEAGANIGAGVLALFTVFLLIVGVILAAIGTIRWLLVRRRRSIPRSTRSQRLACFDLPQR